MNVLLRLPLLSLLLLLVWAGPTPAQDADTTSTDTAPPGSTVITSDELRSDQGNHTAVFTGNVLVTGTNFTLACQEMTVIFTKDGKVDTITAVGNVVINQPGRVAHCGQCQYFREEDKFVLTDQPVILDNKNQISAPKITIYRTQKKMITQGMRSKVILSNTGIGSGAAAPSTDH